MQTTPGPHTLARAPEPLSLVFSEDAWALYDVEPRRALALLRALQMSGDTLGLRALLHMAGRRDADNTGEIHLGTQDCIALAHALRTKGQPLTDDGVVAFKTERGFSNVVRISPEVAVAYARLAMGKDLRIHIAPEAFASLDTESQRALKILGMVSHDEDEITAIGRALGVQGTTITLTSSGVEMAQRLAKWARAHNMAFTNDGLNKLAQTLDWSSAMLSPKLARFVVEALLLRDEPTHDYSRLSFDGCTLNGRTLAMLNALDRRLAAGLRVLKGSYEVDGARGAHPHMGGGTVDLGLGDVAPHTIEAMVRALRAIGFAAWFRDRHEHPHIHAVAIGDREMSPAAAWQVKQFFSGKDGRSRMGADPHGALLSLPAWVQKYRLAT